MARKHQVQFSGPVTVFHERTLSERGTPAGYAALLDAYELKVPLPRTLSCTGEHHRVREEGGWRILTPRHTPPATLEGHLTFALKYEGLDLAVLKRIFQTVGAQSIEAMVKITPTGTYARRIWFLYEWLLGERLNLPDAEAGAYTKVVDADQQWAIKGTTSPRHRLWNNLPGTAAFCPMVFRTTKLDDYIQMDLASRAQAAVAAVPRDLLARTAAFLLLKDSKSSYAIEGERPPQDRIQRWGRAIGEAGRHPLSLGELLRLQMIVIGDARFVKLGLREEGGFIGEHDRESRLPLPDHIGARDEDLPALVDGMMDFERATAGAIDAVIAAAILAFGFVYVHPFVDGNGRLHRYLIHHVLAGRGFHPKGVVFPVSSAILENIEMYRAVLEDYSKRLLPVIEWRATAEGNVQVQNDTGDFYRFFDATPHAEFLYECVRKTIEEDLPRETEFLARYDRFRTMVETVVDMPQRTMDLLFRFMRQNNGSLSKRSREREFSKLTNEEVHALERAYADIFERE
ncbi:MAG: Fic family protein [Candidatus Solibacter usitatus]|nr:Fic family protein [Candidatus Solibacter usitatus]